MDDSPPSDSGELPLDLAVDSAADPEWHQEQRGDSVTHCSRCHRLEHHFPGLRGRWYYPYLLGFSLGTIYLFGPYRCRCCGAWRWFRYDGYNPFKWISILTRGLRR